MAAVYTRLVEQGGEAVMATHGGAYEFVLRRHGIPYEVIEPRLTPEQARRLLEGLTFRPWKPIYEPSVLEAHVRSEMELLGRHDARVGKERAHGKLGQNA